MGVYRSTKSFWNYPCAHRQWRHEGHCSKVHGYSRSFHFLFAADTLDDKGFVVDFSGLEAIKDFLTDNFDHTLLINPDDPLLEAFESLHIKGACDLVTPPYGVSMEGTARWVLEECEMFIRQLSGGRCRIIQVEVRENDKNSGIFKVD